MKEKDLDKNLDNIIIDGLIKEAEQENIEFAATMQLMSDEEFENIVRQPAFADYDDYDMVVSESSMLDADDDEGYYARIEDTVSPTGAFEKSETAEIEESSMAADMKFPADSRKIRTHAKMTLTAASSNRPPIVLNKAERISAPEVKKSKFRRFRPWLAAAVSAAAIILIVLIPSMNSMDARLCDSALYMSEAYITAPKGGFDISSASIEQIKAELPALEERYEATIIEDGKLIHYTEDFQDAGWTLAVAYLKLHKKSDAVKVLRTLESQTQGTPFGNHCAKMLEQLD